MIRRTPSVSAAGPGCRMSADLISKQLAVPHRGNLLPARPRRDALGPEFLAAPRAEHHVRVALRTTSCGSATMRPRGRLRARTLGKHILAAGDLDQLAHPADAADHRLVPFLEVDARSAGKALAPPRGLRRRPVSSRCDQRGALLGSADQRREHRGSSRGSRRTERWLKIMMFSPALARSRAMSACRSEKPSTRSGFSSRILSIFALTGTRRRAASRAARAAGARCSRRCRRCAAPRRGDRASRWSPRSGRRCAPGSARHKPGHLHRGHID